MSVGPGHGAAIAIANSPNIVPRVKIGEKGITVDGGDDKVEGNECHTIGPNGHLQFRKSITVSSHFKSKCTHGD